MKNFDTFITDMLAKQQELKAVRVYRSKKDAKQGFYTSGVMFFTLTVGTDADHDYRLTCYNDDWHVMGEESCYRSSSRRFTLGICSKRIWMPGEYTVLVECDNELRWMITFSYGEEGVITYAHRPLAENDRLCQWHRALSEGNPKWATLSHFQGVRHLIPQLLELSRKQENRQQYNLCEENEEIKNRAIYATVTARLPFHAARVGYCLPQVLHWGTSTFTYIKCMNPFCEEEELTELEGRTVLLRDLSGLFQPEGKYYLEWLEGEVVNKERFTAYVLCGTAEELQRLFKKSAVLKECFARSIDLDVCSHSVGELVHHIQYYVKEVNCHLSHEAEQVLVSQVLALQDKLTEWAQEEVEAFANHLQEKVDERVYESFPEEGKPSWAVLTTVRPEDIDLETYLERWLAEKERKEEAESPAFDFEESMRSLREMVGLNALKEQLTDTFFQVRFAEQRRIWGLSADNQGTFHMIFTGNPGTGKTTVAKHIGEIFHGMGLLSSGEVIATERTKLVGRYIGETEEQMKELLERAKGNVLFIDEAYALFSDKEDNRDFGNHVINALLTVLSEPNPDMIVILAGYEEEMEKLLEMNPGLKGRFPYRFHFDDYGACELRQIADNWLEKQQYNLSDKASVLLNESIDRVLEQKDRYFCNARWVLQFFTAGVLPAMARRVMSGEECITEEMCRTIQREDIEQAACKFCPKPKLVLESRRRIGFRA